jgi:hypothetical protein
VLVAVVAGLGYFVSSRAESTLQTSARQIHTSTTSNSNSCIGAQSVFNKCAKSFGYINNNYSQIAFSDKYDYLLDSSVTCSSVDGRKNDSKLTTFCEVGDLNSKREITIWGDSHAQHWINPVDKIGRKNNIKINVIGTSYCFGSSELSKNCSIRFNSIKESGVLDNSESIIVAMWHTAKVTTPGNNALNAINTLRSLTNNSTIYLLEDTPVSGEGGGPDCTMLRLSCKNSIENATSAITKDSAELISMKVLKPDQIIPVQDMFCDSTYCYSNIGGTHVYRDKNIDAANKNIMNSHMTGSFAYSTWPMLEKKLKDSGALKSN